MATATTNPRHWPTSEHAELFAAIASLRTTDEVERFLRDLCTISELDAMAHRWQVASLRMADGDRRVRVDQKGRHRPPHQLRAADHGVDLVDLERGCWCLARIFQPGVDVESYQERVEAWSRELRVRLASCDSDTSRAVALAQFFGKDLGLRGNEEDYYNARNSLLPCVMDSRLGIPISLSLLYMIVGQRAAIQVEGINLPGHFVVRHGGVLLDPFHEGRILTTSDCVQILSGQQRTFRHDHLQTAHPKLILIRMLANLLYIFQHEQNGPLHQMIMRWIQLLDPK